MNEQELLVDALKRLNRVRLPYMLRGSMASNYWGIPRTTHDLDFVVQLPVSSIPQIVSEFQNGYYIQEDAVRAALKPPYQFNAIDNRSALKIDFWVLQPVVFEQEMFHRRTQVTIFRELAWIATMEDVILHKLFWNQITPSERQLGDAAGIVAVQRDNLDSAYLKKWAEQIGVVDTLEKLLCGRITPKRT